MPKFHFKSTMIARSPANHETGREETDQWQGSDILVTRTKQTTKWQPPCQTSNPVKIQSFVPYILFSVQKPTLKSSKSFVRNFCRLWDRVETLQLSWSRNCQHYGYETWFRLQQHRKMPQVRHTSTRCTKLQVPPRECYRWFCDKSKIERKKRLLLNQTSEGTYI